MRPSSAWRAIAMVLEIIIACVTPTTVLSQSLWLDCNQHPALAFEILKPKFDDASILSSTTVPTSVAFLSLRYPLTTRAVVVTELPFAHGGTEFSTASGQAETLSQSALGNPYLGLEFHRPNSLFFMEVGARAPVTRTGNLGAIVALLSEFADRSEAFVPDYLPLIAMGNLQYHGTNGFAIRLRAGPSFWINTDKQEREEGTEWFILYSAQAGYETGTVSAQGGATGRWFLSTEEGNFGERTVNELGLALSLGMGRVWPGAQFQLPLDADLKEVLDFSVGLHVAIRLE